MLRAKVRMGDNTNKNLLDLSGKIVSLVKSLIPSAIGCNKPKGPTTFGPFRRYSSYYFSLEISKISYKKKRNYNQKFSIL